MDKQLYQGGFPVEGLGTWKFRAVSPLIPIDRYILEMGCLHCLMLWENLCHCLPDGKVETWVTHIISIRIYIYIHAIITIEPAILGERDSYAILLQQLTDTKLNAKQILLLRLLRWKILYHPCTVYSPTFRIKTINVGKYAIRGWYRNEMPKERCNDCVNSYSVSWSPWPQEIRSPWYGESSLPFRQLINISYWSNKRKIIVHNQLVREHVSSWEPTWSVNPLICYIWCVTLGIYCKYMYLQCINNSQIC